MDLLTALRQKFGTVNVSGEFYYFECPTCAVDNRRKKKRYIGITGGVSGCWICQQRFTLAELLKGRNVDIQMDGATKMTLDRLKKEKKQQATTLPYTKLIPINQLPDDHVAKRFLRKDHLHDFDIYAERYGIGFIPKDGGTVYRYSKPFITSAERLYFPAFFNGQYIGWQLRSIPGTEYGDLPDCRKYHHCFSKGNYLYNYDQAVKHKFVIVVEGVKKALKFTNAVATWGKGISQYQKQLLLSWSTIILMLDAEAETQAQALQMQLEYQKLGRICINIDLGKYGYPSPDEAEKDKLHEIVCREFSTITGI